MKSADTPTSFNNKSDTLSVFFATCMFTSYVPTLLMNRFARGALKSHMEEHKRTGAGFVGTVCGLLTFVLLPPNVSSSFPGIFFGFLCAVASSGRAEQVLGIKDDPRIVIDEWIGMWVAAWGLQPAFSWPLIITFILFRIFDIVKGPWGRYLQTLPGGWGIVMDDVFAGLLANVCFRLIANFIVL